MSAHEEDVALAVLGEKYGEDVLSEAIDRICRGQSLRSVIREVARHRRASPLVA